jgi:hypothetical protein
LNNFNAAGKTLKDLGVLVLMMMSAGLKCVGERQQNLLLNMRKTSLLRKITTFDLIYLSIYLSILSTTRLIHCCLSSPLLLLLNALIDRHQQKALQQCQKSLWAWSFSFF